MRSPTIEYSGSDYQEPEIRDVSVTEYFNFASPDGVDVQVFRLLAHRNEVSQGFVPYTFPTVWGEPLSPVVSQGHSRLVVQLPGTLGVLPVGCTEPRPSGVDTVEADLEAFDLAETPMHGPVAEPANPVWIAGHCTDSTLVSVGIAHAIEWRLDGSNRSTPIDLSSAVDTWTFRGPRTGFEASELGGFRAEFVSLQRLEEASRLTAIGGIVIGIDASLIAASIASAVNRRPLPRPPAIGDAPHLPDSSGSPSTTKKAWPGVLVGAALLLDAPRHRRRRGG